MLRMWRKNRDQLQVSAVWMPTETVGACEHLRLQGPFGWLEQNEGCPPLDFAVKRRTPPLEKLRVLDRVRPFTGRGPARQPVEGSVLPGESAVEGTSSASGKRASLLATAARHLCRHTRPGKMITTWRSPIVLDPAPSTSALLIRREAVPAHTENAFDLARQRRIPVVYDTDDLLIAVPDHSPLAEEYRTMRPMLTRWIRQADHVTVANEALSGELAELNPSISVLPSFMDVELWGVSEVSRPDETPVSIGYWGTLTHLTDLQPLTEGFRHLKQRYGRRIRFQFMGTHDPEIVSLEDVTIGAYVDSYAAYAAATRESPLDIAIAPLADNRFNRCKSPIKFFEYSIRGACGLFADLAPYRGVIRHGENGFLIGADPDEWIGALEQLIEDPAMRYRMASQAQKDVLAHHTLEHHAWRWRQTYQGVAARGPLRTRRSVGRHGSSR